MSRLTVGDVTPLFRPPPVVPDPTTTAHLTAVFSITPERFYVIVSCPMPEAGGRWASWCFEVNDLDGITQAVAGLDAQGRNVYVRTTLLDQPLKPAGCWSWQRGGAEGTAAVVALCLDVDIAGPGHAPSNGNLPLPPDMATALAILAELPPPSIWIDTGGGAHLWWLLDEAVTDEPCALVESWADRIVELFSLAGYHVDRPDPARVLRPAGTHRRKPGLPVNEVTAVELDPTRRYGSGDLLERLPVPERPEPAPRTPRPVGEVGPANAVAALSWSEILTPERFTFTGWARIEGKPVELWRRDGASSHYSLKAYPDGAAIVHSDACGLPTGRGLSKFSAYALLRHPGLSQTDAEVAAGTEIRRVATGQAEPTDPTMAAAADVLARPHLWGAELDTGSALLVPAQARGLVGLSGATLPALGAATGLLGGDGEPALDPEQDRAFVAIGETVDSLRARMVSGGSFLLDIPEGVPAVWGEADHVLWAEGEALLIVGPPGVGKTTVVGQLVRARLGLAPTVLGLPVAPTSSKILYLAMDRPAQIARALRRGFTETDRAVLDDRLVVWKGPPPADLAEHPDLLLALASAAGADTVVGDSLKDMALGLSEDAVGAGINRAVQTALAAGVEVVIPHHQRKGQNGEKPKKLEDVYGSTWITAGTGSVVLLWGEAGAALVELVHLKPPAAEVGPWTIEHDHDAGTSTVVHGWDALRWLRLRPNGGTITEGAQAMTAKSKHTPLGEASTDTPRTTTDTECISPGQTTDTPADTHRQPGPTDTTSPPIGGGRSSVVSAVTDFDHTPDRSAPMPLDGLAAAVAEVVTEHGPIRLSEVQLRLGWERSILARRRHPSHRRWLRGEAATRPPTYRPHARPAPARGGRPMTASAAVWPVVALLAFGVVAARRPGRLERSDPHPAPS
jgi:KaiC/GvpD/RAD55 family RecA-like ATPase